MNLTPQHAMQALSKPDVCRCDGPHPVQSLLSRKVQRHHSRRVEPVQELRRRNLPRQQPLGDGQRLYQVRPRQGERDRRSDFCFSMRGLRSGKVWSPSWYVHLCYVCVADEKGCTRQLASHITNFPVARSLARSRFAPPSRSRIMYRMRPWVLLFGGRLFGRMHILPQGQVCQRDGLCDVQGLRGWALRRQGDASRRVDRVQPLRGGALRRSVWGNVSPVRRPLSHRVLQPPGRDRVQALPGGAVRQRPWERSRRLHDACLLGRVLRCCAGEHLLSRVSPCSRVLSR